MKKKLLIGLTCTAAIMAESAHAQKTKNQTQQKPNIIYILADDLGYGDLGCYGQKIIKTPNLDRMAKQGVLFTQHYAGSTVSAPSRSSLMTGLHTGHTYIRGNVENSSGEGQHPLPASTFTIAKMLKQVGYTTGIFGKWGLGYPGSEGDPLNQGFDEFYGYNCQRLAHNYYPYHLWHDRQMVMLPGNEGNKKEQYSQDLIHSQAMSFINNNKDKPFFAFLPYVLPHAELVVPKDSILNYYKDNIKEGKPYSGADSQDNKFYKNGGYGSSEHPHADFAAMVTRLDWYVGEILNQLAELGIADNTIVIFTSDNGPHREGGADPDFFNSYGELRGVKRDLYEGGIRVPFIAQWPGKIPSGTKSDHVSAFWDMMPTFADIAHAKSPKGIDGISMFPSLTGKKGQKEHEYLYWEFHEMGGRVAVRYQNWKGVKLQYGNNPNSPMELYDLFKDVGEKNNIASENPDIADLLESYIKKARTNSELFNF